MRSRARLLTVLLALAFAAESASAAITPHAEKPASGSATVVENRIGENARLSGEGVEEIPAIAYDIASGFSVAAKSTEKIAADLVRARRPSAAVRQQADQAATDATGKLRCQYCGKEIKPEAGSPTSREYDHVNPYSRGGTNDIGNIKDSCRTCNRSKGARTPEEWGGPGQ